MKLISRLLGLTANTYFFLKFVGEINLLAALCFVGIVIGIIGIKKEFDN